MVVNNDRVRLLVDALRSGEYKQGEGSLRRNLEGNPKFCCLGVACDIAKKNGLEIKILGDEEDDNDVFYDEEGEFLPDSVRDWYGFVDMDPIVDTELHGKILATEANDTYELDFPAIAKAFEDEYLNDKADS